MSSSNFRFLIFAFVGPDVALDFFGAAFFFGAGFFFDFFVVAMTARLHEAIHRATGSMCTITRSGFIPRATPATSETSESGNPILPAMRNPSSYPPEQDHAVEPHDGAVPAASTSPPTIPPRMPVVINAAAIPDVPDRVAQIFVTWFSCSVRRSDS